MKNQPLGRIARASGIVLILASLSVPAVVAAGGQLKMAVIQADSPGQVKKLASMGLDIAAVRRGPVQKGPRGLEAPGYRIEAVISQGQGKALRDNGYVVQDIAARAAVAIQSLTGESVYHSFDEPGTGIRDQLQGFVESYPELAEVESIGRTYQGREIPAIRLSRENRGHEHGRGHDRDDRRGFGYGHEYGKGRGHDHKPRVLFHATTHAREWVSTEVAMRLIKYLLGNYGSDPRVTELLDTTEIWIVPVANPDGYQYTFTDERLWRKNLRDNDGDGQITLIDGVDINRNFNGHWGYDNEGSSGAYSDATYRGPAPESEPETRALTEFMRDKKFQFAVSYHTYGNLILYPWGWQVKTPSNDDPVFVALAGTDANPAVFDNLLGQGYDPGVGADLYITNGEFTDWAYEELGVPAYTIELTYGSDADGVSNFYGFEFPDDEGMVQQVFEDNLEFALSLAESAKDPAHPVSPVGIETADLYHTPLTDSYGEKQIVDVIARRGMRLKLKYKINGGRTHRARFEDELGDFYNIGKGVFYSRYQAVIEGQQAGDVIDYEVRGGDSAISGSYTVTSASGNPILVVAAEDYSGGNPDYSDTSQPNYLRYYTAALDAGGYAYDVWDVDTQGIPDYAEVLSHYRVVIWYTGDDYAAVVPLGLDTQEAEVLNFRDHINYAGGKLFASGQDLSWLSSAYGYYSDDFFQYYLGAYIDLDTGGIDPDSGQPASVRGVDGDPVFDGLGFNLFGGDGADNQCCSSTFITTNAVVPNFGDELAARYDRVGGPFDPHSGDYHVYSQLADQAHKRLGGTFTLPAGTPSLRFWMSYDIETDWDYAFVEISVAGTDSWTTLPDLNGGTSTDTGQSCLSGWVDQIHNFLGHYMDATCNPTGTTGSWNAFTGNSSGWQPVEMDLSAYAGQTVEIYISYASDWATQNLGVFVDDVEISGSPLEDFETGLGQWQVSAGPAGAFNNWVRTTSEGIPEGPATRTPYSVYLGFGFEAIDSADSRNRLMDRVMKYLGQ